MKILIEIVIPTRRMELCTHLKFCYEIKWFMEHSQSNGCLVGSLSATYLFPVYEITNVQGYTSFSK